MKGKHRFVLILCLSAISTIFLSVILVSFPFNPVQNEVRYLKNSFKYQFRLFLPEGFSFFTRDPNENYYQVYKINGHKISNLFNSNSHIDNYLGLKRKSRFMYQKVSEVINAFGSEGWAKTNLPVDSLILSEKLTKEIHQTNLMGDYFTGQHLITKIKPIPWAYSTIKNYHPEYEYKIIQFNK